MGLQFITEQAIALKRHCDETLKTLGASKADDIEIRSMTWSELGRTANDIMKRSKSLIAQVNDNMSEREAKSIEDAFEAMLAIHDEIQNEKDTRTMLDDKSPRGKGDDNPNEWKRPIPADKVARSYQDDGHTEAFTDWLRSPHSESRKMELASVEKRLSSGLTGAAGGYSVPESLVTPILSRARDENPFRQLCRVIRVSTSDIKLPLSQADATSGWVGESDTRTATTEPTLAIRAPTFGTSFANVSVTEELLEDSVLDVGKWFSDEVGRAMGEAEMSAIVSGDGVDKPSGLFNVAPEAAADGARTDLALKYLPSGLASTLGGSTSDLLIEVVYDLSASYRRNAVWCMNSATAGLLRKLKNGSGDYLWVDGIRQGQPATLLGFEVAIAESMDSEGANTHPILFGDFNRGYVIADRVGLTILPDPFTTKGRISYYVRSRVGGIVFDENAIRAIKCATS